MIGKHGEGDRLIRLWIYYRGLEQYRRTIIENVVVLRDRILVTLALADLLGRRHVYTRCLYEKSAIDAPTVVSVKQVCLVFRIRPACGRLIRVQLLREELQHIQVLGFDDGNDVRKSHQFANSTGDLG